MLRKYISKYLQNRPAFFALIRPQEAELFEQNKNLLKPPILDLGCGDGFFASLVWGKGKIDVGLDLVNERTRKIETAKIYKIIKYYNGVKIPYPDAYFQTVVSNCVLEHVEKLPELLEEIYRVLKNGGIFLTSVATDKWESFLFGTKIFGKNYVSFMRKKQDHRNLLSSEEWRKEYHASGFKIEKEFGYLSRATSQWLDIFHYISAFELISYKLFQKWVLFPKIIEILQTEKLIEKLIVYPKTIKESAAIFFVLQK